MNTIVQIVEWIVGLILLYLLLTHGDSVVAIFRSVGGFAIQESMVLQGR